MTSPSQTPPGWYPDPSGGGGQRYWDGNQWTDNFSGGSAPAGAPGGGAPVAAGGPVGPVPSFFWAGPAAAVLAVIGSIGTWVKVSVDLLGQSQSQTAGGLDGDGVLTLILTLIAGGLLGGWFATRKKALAIGAAVAAGLGFLIAFYHAVDPSTTEDIPEIPGLDISAGWGVWLATLALLALTVVSVLLAMRRESR
jgi:hypothetical protein